MPLNEAQPILAGRRVLVVEDEYFLADDFCRTLRRLGADVIGPVPNTAAAAEVLKDGSEPFDWAVLDINLQGDLVFPIAEVLQERNIPFVFATGYGDGSIPERFQNVPRWEKPLDNEALARALPQLRAVA